MKNHNFCIYHDVGRADEVVDQLLSAGIGRSQISILTTKATGARCLKPSQESRASNADGAVASAGGAVGLLRSTLIASATAGIGVLAAGPVLTGLIESSAGGSSGNLLAILVGAGIPEDEAKFYAQEIADKNAILVGAQASDSDRDIVRQIMRRRTLGISAHA